MKQTASNEDDKPIPIRCRQNSQNDFTVLGEQIFKGMKVTRVNDIVIMQGLGFYPAAHLKKLASLYRNAKWEMVYSPEDEMLHITTEDDGIKVQFNLKNQFELVKKGKFVTFDLVDPHKVTETAVEAPVPVTKPQRKPRQPKPIPQPVGLGGWLRGWLGKAWGNGRSLTPTHP